MKIKQIFICIAFLCNSESFWAQNFSVGYDANGNRISRAIIPLKSASVNSSQHEADTSKYYEKMDDFVISVFPNPTEGELKIEISRFDLVQNSSIKVFNSQGSLIVQMSSSGSDYINLTKYPPGYYIMQIDINGKKSEWKILKE